MSQSSINDYDRRSSDRSIINGTTHIKLANHDTLNPAVILDLSQTGVLIGVAQKLDIHSEFCLLVESRTEQQRSYEIYAEVIRLEKSLGDECYTYGCSIQEVRIF